MALMNLNIRDKYGVARKVRGCLGTTLVVLVNVLVGLFEVVWVRVRVIQG